MAVVQRKGKFGHKDMHKKKIIGTDMGKMPCESEGPKRCTTSSRMQETTGKTTEAGCNAQSTVSLQPLEGALILDFSAPVL
jgi:hypothetical protein